MQKPLKWGIIGCGKIAQAFANGLNKGNAGKLAAVASRSIETARAFAKEHGGVRAHGSYDAILADREVDIIYICTPHPYHAEWAIKAADAGKHVLCEKPMAVNFAEAMIMAEAAKRNKVFLMEAFMYRHHPQTIKLAELVRDKAVGEVRIIQASFGFGGGYETDLNSRLFASSLAGGGILDVGCYPVSMARLIAGAAEGKPFADPIEVRGTAKIGAQSRVDEWAVADMRFGSGILAQLATGVRVTLENRVVVYGAEGSIIVPMPWTADRANAAAGKIIVNRKGKEPETIEVPASATAFTLEAENAARAVLSGQVSSLLMSPEDSLGNMKALDQWRENAVLTYDCESSQSYAQPVDKRPLAVRGGSVMKYNKLPGIDMPLSRLIMGVDNQKTPAHAAAMFDDFYARGGNTFDTAWIYAGGKYETLFGEWFNSRKVRDKIAIIVKGAHTPYCRPEYLTPQFNESLERLKTGYADIYFMHRDNTDIPVGEFMGVLNDLKAAGKIRAFGASNWTLKRVKEAQEWARKNKKSGFTALSNNFSLARMIAPVWAGCEASSSPDYYQWHCETKTPVFAWSSQARGFFVPGLAAPDKLDNAEMVKCWYSPENFERRKRCFELAEELKVRPINVALAYVLHQPFDTWALIGPRAISETSDSFEGLKVTLTTEQVKWLDLRD